MGAFEDLMNASSDSFVKAGKKLNKTEKTKAGKKLNKAEKTKLKSNNTGNEKILKSKNKSISKEATEYQHSNDTVTPQERPKNDILTDKKQLKSNLIPDNKATTKYHLSNNLNETKIVLPKLQYEVYIWLKNLGITGSFNKPFLVEQTGIKYPTVRKSLNSLKSNKIIKLDYSYSTREHYYEINTSIHVEGPQSNRILPPKEQVNNNKVAPSLSSSRFNNNKKSISKEKILEIENILQTHPELGYWRELKLTAKQVYNWLKIADCNLDLMIKYLSYCAFDIVNENKKIRNPFNYFFRVIEKSGQYPKSSSYKSHQKKKIEDMEKIIAEQEAEAKKLENLRQKKWKVEKNLKFQKMMNDPESSLYKKCFSRLNNFSKTLKGSLLEKSMKGAYEELIEEENNKILEKAHNG